ETAKGDNKIGSTLKGIGPTYQDKIGRQGLRVGDILADDFRERFDRRTEVHFKILKDHNVTCNWDELEKPFLEAIDFLRTFLLIESEYFLNQELRKGSTILAEGAQGSLLDIDVGRYPFVTSSNTV